MNHDYSKSPAMEAIDEDEDVEIERELMMETNQIGANDQKSTSPTEKQEQIESNLPAKTEESNGSKPGTALHGQVLFLARPMMSNGVQCLIRFELEFSGSTNQKHELQRTFEALKSTF